MKRTDGHYPVYWPEQAEHDPVYELVVPPWSRLETEAILFRETLRLRRAQGLPLPPIALDVPDRHRFGTVPHVVLVDPETGNPAPERFDLKNIFCFQYLPSIIGIKEEAA